MIEQKTLIVHEIHFTIQGESTRVGRPCVLVRLAGCPQSCSYCDTPEARPFDAGKMMTIAEIVREVETLLGPCPTRPTGLTGQTRLTDLTGLTRLVEITGGEPLAQPSCSDLARCLLECGLEVVVETSGRYPIDALPLEAVKIVDMKCPSSGECEHNDLANLGRLGMKDEVKFVIADHGDYEWARTVVERHGLVGRCEILFSPAHGRLDPRLLAEWILADRLPVRLQLQMHKYIWGPNAKGV